jgi:hypothetical protein
MLHEFKSSESGAVTVDWVVLSAAIVGLGISTLGIVASGVADLAGDTADQLSGQDLTTQFGRVFNSIVLAANDFSNGDLGGWTGVSIFDAGGEMGEVLYIDQRQTAALHFEIPADASNAIMGFTLFGGDTLDNEDAIISINGIPVVIATGYHGTMSIEIPQVDGTIAMAQVMVEQVNMGSGGRYLNAGDSKAVVSINVSDPPDGITLGIYSDNSHGKNGDEFWAIDDVLVTAS